MATTTESKYHKRYVEEKMAPIYAAYGRKAPAPTINKIRRPSAPELYVYDVWGHGNSWHWRLWASNGKIVAIGGESYKRKKNAVYMYPLFNIGPGYCALFINGKRID